MPVPEEDLSLITRGELVLTYFFITIFFVTMISLFVMLSIGSYTFNRDQKKLDESYERRLLDTATDDVSTWTDKTEEP